MSDYILQSKIDKLNTDMDEIVKQFGQIDNIPMNHPYWSMRKERNSLNLKARIKDPIDYEPVK